METARVGKQAPDFETPACFAGRGFGKVRLSDHRGKWVVLSRARHLERRR
jgi:alkyl hydroperoxide reductase subunit AhpC